MCLRDRDAHVNSINSSTGIFLEKGKEKTKRNQQQHDLQRARCRSLPAIKHQHAGNSHYCTLTKIRLGAMGIEMETNGKCCYHSQRPQHGREDILSSKAPGNKQTSGAARTAVGPSATSSALCTGGESLGTPAACFESNARHVIIRFSPP